MICFGLTTKISMYAMSDNHPVKVIVNANFISKAPQTHFFKYTAKMLKCHKCNSWVVEKVI